MANPRYHHGDLRRTLLITLPQLIAEYGPDKFSLRELARRAGVTHGAPAHHFRDKQGLLTTFAKEGAQHLAKLVLASLAAVEEQDHVGRLTAVGLGYLEFALQYREHFRVTFRPELLDMQDAALLAARAGAGATLDLVLRAAQSDGCLAARDYAAVRMASWSLAHGYACLAVEVMNAASAEALRRQAERTFRLYSERMLVAGPGSAVTAHPAGNDAANAP